MEFIPFLYLEEMNCTAFIDWRFLFFMAASIFNAGSWEKIYRQLETFKIDSSLTKVVVPGNIRPQRSWKQS
jgi:hypothetical protein